MERFRSNVAPYIGLKPEMDRDEKAWAYPARTLTLGEIVDCLSDAGLLSLPEQQEEEEEGRCAPKPPAGGPVGWAVLNEECDLVYDNFPRAQGLLSVMVESGEDGYRLYEIREVS